MPVLPVACSLLALIVCAAFLMSQPAPKERVGPLPDGGFLLNSGWRLKPAGKQTPLGTLPMSSALSPDGRHLLVLNGGYNPPSISVLDIATAAEVSRAPVPDGWLGLAFAPNGGLVYVGGGSQASVFEFSFANGKLEPARTFPVVSNDKRTPQDFIGDVAFSPDGRLIYAAELFRNSVAVINPQSGMVIERFKTGRRPCRILFHPDGKSFFVSSWADGSVYHHEAANGNVLARVRVAPHPTDMVWRPGGPEAPEGAPEVPPYAARVFVAAANTNRVYAIGVSESNALRLVETIDLSWAASQPAGMTPSALALSADGGRLFVACSDVNAVAVVDVSEPWSRALGFVPAGWYPTAVRALPDGRLVVLNGRGLRSYPNPDGTEPAARIQTGTASFIEPFGDEDLEQYTKTVLTNSPYFDLDVEQAGGEKNPVPVRPGAASPIEHVVYIVKEGLAYDHVLGDMKEGNGDASLAAFGEQATPNHHKLAREFVLFDNFYVNGDVAADGLNWSLAAIAPDFVQRLWPNAYRAGRRDLDFSGEPAAAPPAGYLWSNAAAAGISMRNYGHFVTNRAGAAADGAQVASVSDPVLRRVTNLNYRGFDPGYPDVERARVFLRDLEEFEKTGPMPRLILIRLANGHSAPAGNDHALGLIVEGVSKSRFWSKTAIFVLEASTGNGRDHVDSHRAPAFIVSPYIRRGIVDSTMYNTTSMLRTIELILGLRPMTLFDASARPMSAAFQPAPDLRPYTAQAPRVPPGNSPR